MVATPAQPESIGPLLTRLRLARGLSQLRLAELLCAAAGVPTVTRHEVSRWERETRIPGRYWLSWLAAVLETPLTELEAAAAAAYDRPTAPAPPGPSHPSVRSAADLLTALAATDGSDLPALAHAWLVNPAETPHASAHPTTGAMRAPAIAQLRRTDDLLGGADLAPRINAELRRILTGLAHTHPDPATWRLLAEWAQLSGWVHADAAHTPAAIGAYRAGLHAATAAGDRPLAAHILGSISHLWLSTGAAPGALLLARTAYTGARYHASAKLRALLHHRIALAAAHTGDRRAAHAGLAAAERVADRVRPDREPPWMYWLDPAELTAMTGRCLAALGRPVRAVPLLSPARHDVGARTTALDAAWLARAYLDLGEVEQACQVAATALHEVVRAGSARVAVFLQRLHPRLRQYRDIPAVRGYDRLTTALTAYLPHPHTGTWAQRAGHRAQ